VQALHRARAGEGGAVILAGVVGSGKSTTIATLMREIPPDRKVITLEDPAEYLIPNALQNTICRTLDEKDDASFDIKLKTIKRSAMNDLLIGEIRDAAGGRALMDLAGCGVNLYTTVHAGSALLIVDRLCSSFIGVARDLLSTPGILKLLVYQCLIARLCRHCAQNADQVIAADRWSCVNGIARDAEWFKRWLKMIETSLDICTKGLRFRRESGCEHCLSGSVSSLNGTQGRTVVAEMIEPIAEPFFLEGLKSRDGLGLYDWFHSRPRSHFSDLDMRGKTAMQCAIYKMSQGWIDPRHVESKFGSFELITQGNRPRA
jgi:type II secretory ATPase GspE/PulE/Tfp pilus assembly ATPase PilB-like protein